MVRDGLARPSLRWIGPALDGKSRCSGRSTPQVLTLKPPRADKVSLHLCLSHDAVPCRCLWLCAERAGAHRVARPRRVDGRREDGVRRRSRYSLPASQLPSAAGGSLVHSRSRGFSRTCGTRMSDIPTSQSLLLVYSLSRGGDAPDTRV